ncbi:MAG: primosomal protein N' [Saprospiraceae bacterium]|nr:primosomal protein N' [Saprospiraceae bacterium]
MSLPKHTDSAFVQVIVPVPIEKPYTYSVPPEMRSQLAFGHRVEVQFGRSRRYAALVVGFVEAPPSEHVKPVLDVIDDHPVITPLQLDFWRWMADYYACSIGEVMHAALPASFKLTSETSIYLLPGHPDDFTDLTDREYLVIQALRNQEELSLDDVKKLLRIDTVLPLVNKLFRLGFIGVQEQLADSYRPKVQKYLRLAPAFRNDPEALHAAFELTQRSERQTQALLAFVQLARNRVEVLQSEVLRKADVKSDVIKALEKKEILEVSEREVNRIAMDDELPQVDIHLTPAQQTAYATIMEQWEDKRVVLLHGATGSGKTWIYKKLLDQDLDQGGQALYLLPEIALTVQVVQRLQRTFGNQVVVAHSGLSNNERVDLWKRVQEGAPLILGVRSSIFLPFQNLTTIIVDEEHDASYKQSDPAPRYHGRDAAIYLASLTGARVLLGSATPSVESFYNSSIEKYGLAVLRERYLDVRFPDLHFVDLRKHKLTKDSQFSRQLVDEIGATLERKEQVIIFKNRRGYAPVVRCLICGWQAMCDRCDVALTYHKYRNNLHCHLCGLQKQIPIVCPDCASNEIRLEGHGTQKIEDELKIIFPDARVSRMDYDTTRRKEAYHKLIDAFEQQEIDILVGTQMVTKGLDFDHVGLVGVLHADQQLYFPHFRAVERTFQLLVQVSGRAGRKETAGQVVIQTYNPTHPVFADVAMNDYQSFFQRELLSRKQWLYPPFFHLIKITLKHKVKGTVVGAARLLAHRLKEHLGNRVLGPAEPGIARVRNQYLMDIGIKIERKPQASASVKKLLREQIAQLHKERGMTTVRVNVDVDPG